MSNPNHPGGGNRGGWRPPPAQQGAWPHQPQGQQPQGQQPQGQQPQGQQPQGQPPQGQPPQGQPPQGQPQQGHAPQQPHSPWQRPPGPMPQQPQDPMPQQPQSPWQQPQGQWQQPQGHAPQQPQGQWQPPQAQVMHRPAAAEPVAAVRFPAPVGPHFPLPPQIVAQLARRPVVQVAEPKTAEQMLSMEAAVPHVLAECARLFQQDKIAEQKIKRANTIALLLGILAVLTFVLYGLGILVGIVAAIVWWRGSKHATADLEDRRLEAVSGALLTLAPELKANKPVKAIVNFSCYTQQPMLTYWEGGTGWFEQKVTACTWSHWWLLLRFVLSDGVQVEVDAFTRVKRKTAQKRKYTKTKDRTTERVVVRLVPPSGKAFGGSMQGRHALKRHAGGMILKHVVVRPRRATLTFETPACMRMCARAGWQANGLENLVDSAKLVAAVVHSYKTVSKAART